MNLEYFDTNGNVTDSPCTSSSTNESERFECPKICIICNLPATGYHYDVASCTGCKTFFRRTITDGRRFACNKKADCFEEWRNEIEGKVKRICQSCRFDRCVEAGMNPRAVQAEIKNDEGRELIREVIARQKHKQEQMVIEKIYKNVGTMESKVTLIINTLDYIERLVQPIWENGVPFGYIDVRTLNDLINSQPVFEIERIPNLVKLPPRFKCDDDRRKNHATRTKYLHGSILASIELAKCLEFIDQLDPDSKIALLKHVTLISSNLMNAYFSVNIMKADRLLLPDGSPVSCSKPPQNAEEVDYYKNHSQNIHMAVATLLRTQLDHVEYLLLKAIFICNPAIRGLSSHGQIIIERERQKYSQSLFNYCMVQRGVVNGPSRFCDLIGISTSLESMQKYQKDQHVFLKALRFAKHHAHHEHKHRHRGPRWLFDEILED
ncbi:unnamed protein product [Caenorhabditis bovis]|uniref:Nuclear receptor domain-containing protein n=1 Tax=Caenorhabditis bovis TaxID=2654633 RepID=A0A8S1EE93_9PELO|nr:unnamed protein product [Caenorhabditis bovis]